MKNILLIAAIAGIAGAIAIYLVSLEVATGGDEYPELGDSGVTRSGFHSMG